MKRVLKEIVLSDDGKQKEIVTVELTYQKGGINYYTYNNDMRGYYLRVAVETIRKMDGYEMREFVLGNGVKSLVLGAAKFSQKVFQSIEVPQEKIKQLVDHVMAKQGVEASYLKVA